MHESDWEQWWTGTPQEKEAPIDPDWDFVGSPVMDVLRDVKEEGLCRYIGITGNNAERVSAVLQNVDVDVCLPAFDYNILRRGTRREVIPLAKSRGVTVLLGAVIRIEPEMEAQMDGLYSVQRESGLSHVELTVRFLLADRDVCTILVGAATPAEIEESVEAAEKGPLPADLHQTLDGLGVL